MINISLTPVELLLLKDLIEDKERIAKVIYTDEYLYTFNKLSGKVKRALKPTLEQEEQ